MFIEAGAFDGVEESCCKAFEEFLDWTGVNVEPSPFTFDLLKANRPTAINVRGALSDHDGDATFTNALHPERGARFGNDSLGHTDAHIDELVTAGCLHSRPSRSRPCDTTRCSSVMRSTTSTCSCSMSKGMSSRFSAAWSVHRCGRASFCIEHGNIGVERLQEYLTPLGYVLDRLAFNNAYFSLPGVKPET